VREDIRKIRGFWLEVPFFGTRVEQLVAERWYVILLLPFLYWVALGVWTGRQSLFLNATSFLRALEKSEVGTIDPSQAQYHADQERDCAL
jgi:hypothetical protein